MKQKYISCIGLNVKSEENIMINLLGIVTFVLGTMLSADGLENDSNIIKTLGVVLMVTGSIMIFI